MGISCGMQYCDCTRCKECNEFPDDCKCSTECRVCHHEIHTGVTCVGPSLGEYQGNDSFCGCRYSQ